MGFLRVSAYAELCIALAQVSMLRVMMVMLTIMTLMKMVILYTLAVPSPESAQSRNHSCLIHLEHDGIDLSPGQPRQSGKRQKGDELALSDGRGYVPFNGGGR